MAHQGHSEQRGIGGVLRSRTGIVLIALLLIAAFYLFTAHTAHTLRYLPFGLLLLCPFLHLFMHGGHGGHGGQATTTATTHAGHQPDRGSQS